MLRRLLINKKLLVIVPVVTVLALAGLFLPEKKISIDPSGMLSIESKIVISVGSEVAYAATTLALYPAGVTTTDAHLGDPLLDMDWLNPGYVGADDTLYATVTNYKNFDLGIYSYRLDAVDFGFEIPDGATIDGIVVEFGRFDDTDNTNDALVQLIQEGTPAGNNNGIGGAAWDAVDTMVPFGTSTDKWGLTWTPALINAANFGVAVACVSNGNNADPQINYLRIIVHYTPSPDILNEPTEINFGTVYTSTDYWSKGSAPVWALDDSECTFTITNLTEVAVDIDIRSTDFTGGTPGWTLGATADTDVVVLKAGESGIANETLMKTLTTSDQAFIAALAGSSATKMWELKMETPSLFSNSDPKSALITLTATLSP